MGRLGGKHKCAVLPRCYCLLPEWGPFHACCGYYCLKCKANLNHRTDERKGSNKKVRTK